MVYHSYIFEQSLTPYFIATNCELKYYSQGTSKDTEYSIHCTIECVDDSASPDHTQVQVIHDTIDDGLSASTTTVQGLHLTQPMIDTIDEARSTAATTVKPTDEHPGLGTVDERIKAAGEAVNNLQRGPSVPSKVSDIVDLGKAVADSSVALNLESLLEKLTILMPLVDEIAKVRDTDYSWSHLL